MQLSAKYLRTDCMIHRPIVATRRLALEILYSDVIEVACQQGRIIRRSWTALDIFNVRPRVASDVSILKVDRSVPQKTIMSQM